MTRTAARTNLPWAMATSFFERFAPALATLMLAPMIGVQETGIASISMAFIFILAIPYKGVSDVIVGTTDLDPKILSTFLAISVGSALLLCAILTALAGPIASLYAIPELARILPLHSLVVLATAAGVLQDGLFQRHFQFARQAARKGIGGAVGFAAGIAYAWFRPDAMALVVYHLTSVAASTLFAWIALRPELSRRIDRSQARVILPNILFQSGGQLCGQVTVRAIDLVTGIILGPVAVGLIRVAMQLYNLITSVIVTPIANILTASFASTAREEEGEHRLKSRFLHNFARVAVFAYPTFGLVGAALPQFLGVAMGSEWVLAGQLGAVVSANGFGGVILLMASPVLVAKGRFADNFSVGAVQAVLSIVATYVGAQFGIWGVAVSVVIRAYISMCFVLHTISRRVGVEVAAVLRTAIKPLAITAIAVAAYYLLFDELLAALSPMVRFVLAFSIAGMGYVALSLILQRSALLELVHFALDLLPRRAHPTLKGPQR